MNKGNFHSLGLHVIETGLVASKIDGDLLLKGIDSFDECFEAKKILTDVLDKKKNVIFVKSVWSSLPIGFLAFDRNVSKDHEYHEVGLKFTYDINFIFVNAAHRGDGYGRALKRSIVDLMENDIRKVSERSFSDRMKIILHMECSTDDGLSFANSLVKDYNYMQNKLFDRKDFNKEFKLDFLDAIDYNEYSSVPKM